MEKKSKQCRVWDPWTQTQCQYSMPCAEHEDAKKCQFFVPVYMQKDVVKQSKTEEVSGSMPSLEFGNRSSFKSEQGSLPVFTLENQIEGGTTVTVGMFNDHLDPNKTKKMEDMLAISDFLYIDNQYEALEFVDQHLNTKMVMFYFDQRPDLQTGKVPGKVTVNGVQFESYDDVPNVTFKERYQHIGAEFSKHMFTGQHAGKLVDMDCMCLIFNPSNIYDETPFLKSEHFSIIKGPTKGETPGYVYCDFSKNGIQFHITLSDSERVCTPESDKKMEALITRFKEFDELPNIIIFESNYHADNNKCSIRAANDIPRFDYYKKQVSYQPGYFRKFFQAIGVVASEPMQPESVLRMYNNGAYANIRRFIRKLKVGEFGSRTHADETKYIGFAPAVAASYLIW